MKQKFFLFLLILFTTVFVYITNIYTIPQNIIIFEDEEYEISLLKGINIEGANISTKENLFKKIAKVGSDFIGDAKVKLSALGGIANNEITVSVVPKVSVIPGGDVVGIQMYSKGVLVVGMSEIDSSDGGEYTPYKNTNIEAGDTILKIDNMDIENIEELKEAINDSNGKSINVMYRRNGETFVEQMQPVKSIETGDYKIGLWVRDGTMGIGTLSFYEPTEKYYGALGHGVSDADIKQILDIEKGKLNLAEILSIGKGQKSKPGEIRGTLKLDKEIGDIVSNTECGIYGKISLEENIMFREREAIPVASRYEIKEGKAFIKCTLDNEGIKEYEVEIEKINNINGINTTKGMIIKITDEELLERTGGIIQGMSGSPIIQNNKFIGAITHVFVNDPTRGYAVFGDTMIKQMREIN